MRDEPHRLLTDEQRDWLHVAKNRGGHCAACGRALDAGEPVYFQRFVFWQVGPTRLTTQAPVGRECVSSRTLARATDQEPERCAGCGRDVFYRQARGDRRRAFCSRACRNRAAAATRRAARARADR